MDPIKPTKSFKKLSLNKDTVQPMPQSQQHAQPNVQTPGAMAASGYCSGSFSCSTFYVCVQG